MHDHRAGSRATNPFGARALALIQGERRTSTSMEVHHLYEGMASRALHTLL